MILPYVQLYSIFITSVKQQLKWSNGMLDESRTNISGQTDREIAKAKTVCLAREGRHNKGHNYEVQEGIG